MASRGSAHKTGRFFENLRNPVILKKSAEQHANSLHQHLSNVSRALAMEGAAEADLGSLRTSLVDLQHQISVDLLSNPKYRAVSETLKIAGTRIETLLERISKMENG